MRSDVGRKIAKSVILIGFSACLFVSYKRTERATEPVSTSRVLNEDDSPDDTDSFDSRKRQLDSWCRLHSSDPYRAESAALAAAAARMNAFHHFVFRGEGTAVCSVHKTGSNSWAAFMLKLAARDMHQDEGDSPSGFEGELVASNPFVSEGCWPTCAQNITKVIVVRHPLQRLLSAWKHVFHRQGHEGPKFGLGHSYSWPEFVEKLLKNPMEDKEWQTAKKAAGDHWEPFWKVCSVCSLDLRPDLVLRLETLASSDLAAYLRLLGLPEALVEQFPHLVRSGGDDGGGGFRQPSPEAVDAFYFGMLTRDTVRRLHQFYRADHELFGYSPDPYIGYAEFGLQEEPVP